MSSNIIEVRWTSPDKEEVWVPGELRAISYSGNGKGVLWVPLDPDNAEWTWACKWEHLHFDNIRLAPPENQLSKSHEVDDGQLELFPLWGTAE